jgi:hypothetical protein
VYAVPLVKLAVRIKDRSHVRYIFAFVQNPKRVGHSGCPKVSFQENHNCLLFVAEFVARLKRPGVAQSAIGQLSGQRQAAGLNTPLSKAVMIRSSLFSEALCADRVALKPPLTLRPRAHVVFVSCFTRLQYIAKRYIGATNLKTIWTNAGR